MNQKKVIIITGASKGIGRAISEKLSSNHIIVMVSRNITVLKELETKFRNDGKEALAIKCDVTSEVEIKKTVDTVIKNYGHIDVIINNAGVATIKSIQDFNLNDYNYMFDVNAKGTFLFCNYIVPYFISQKSGQIINISSDGSLVGFKGGSLYSSSKSAVNLMSESIYFDLKQYGIAVSVICAGSVRTYMNGKPAFQYDLEPEDVANTVNYLINETETANSVLIKLEPRRRQEFRDQPDNMFITK